MNGESNEKSDLRDVRVARWLHRRAEQRTREDNIAEEIAKLKEQPGKNMALGGAGIALTFMRLGLIDEYGLYVHPVIIGDGTPMFPALDNKINLRLVETRQFSSGVVLLRYQPDRNESN